MGAGMVSAPTTFFCRGCWHGTWPRQGAWPHQGAWSHQCQAWLHQHQGCGLGYSQCWEEVGAPAYRLDMFRYLCIVYLLSMDSDLQLGVACCACAWKVCLSAEEVCVSISIRPLIEFSAELVRGSQSSRYTFIIRNISIYLKSAYRMIHGLQHCLQSCLGRQANEQL